MAVDDHARRKAWHRGVATPQLTALCVGLLLSPVIWAQQEEPWRPLRMTMQPLSPEMWAQVEGASASSSVTQELGSEGLHLPAVLSAVVRFNPGLVAKKSRLDAAFEDVAIFERRFYPSAGFSAQSRSATQGGAVGELSVRQPLYTFGALTADVEVAKKQTEVNRWELVSQERISLVEAVEAVRQLEEARSLTAVVRTADTKYAAFASMMARRVLGGVSAPIETELLQARRVQNDVDKNRFKIQAQDAASRIEQLSGGVLQRAALLAMADVDEAVALDAEAFLAQVKLDIVSLVRNLPTVLATQVTVDLERERLKAQKAKLLPKLELGWSKQISQNSNQLSQSQRSGVLSLLFSVDTTGGLSGWSALKADTTRLTAFMREADAKAGEVERDVRLAMNAIELAIGREPLLARAVSSNQDVLASYERQFIVGRKSWIEVLNAVRELQTSQLDLVRNKVDQKYALVRLRVQLGLDPLGKGM